MTLNEITTAMQTYANARNSQGLNQMQNWFSQGNMFYYLRDNTNVPIPPDNQAYVHAYPGILSDGQLVFFVISAYRDSPNTQNIQNYVQVCSVSNGAPSSTSNGGIPVQEAIQRIDAWKKGYQAWLQANISQTNSIFQSYIIPQVDTGQGTQHKAFLALKPVTTAPGYAIADSIIEDVDPGVVYMDTVDFIPPMGDGEPKKAKARFHLLNLLP